MSDEITKAHKFSSNHREELDTADVCGCFFCMEVFNPNMITEWIDNGKTALCPKCGIDSIIGESSGYPITKEFLKGMNGYWF
ncbi:MULTISPECIES: cytoplasmic protein [Bacillus]|uniref:cytoplasmic protein n=1 Tax=Bacillus TaxID=1386 RepID=UPI000BB9B612|nr:MULTISPECIES: cytoplasmic protein [Bacillus]